MINDFADELYQDKLEEHLKEKDIHRRRRVAKERERKRIEELSEMSWMLARNRGAWLQRCYRGENSAYLKRQANKKARRYKNLYPHKGNVYKKAYEYWYQLI